MKKLFALCLSVLIAGSVLTACGGSASSAPGAASAASGSPGTKVVIQAGYENNPGEPIDQAMHKWADLIKEKSNGTMELQLFPSSQLGSKNDLIDQMIAGSSIVTIADGAFYADRGVKDFGIVFAPYLFDTWDQCWALTKSDWYVQESKQLEDQGLKLLTSNWIYGDRQTLTRKPVKSVSDLKGMKIRVPNNKIQIATFQVLGASPTPMDLGEVYTALQQGTIDGLENPLSVLYNGKYYEVAKYLILDDHVKNFTTWVCGSTFFNSLTKEQQDILTSTGDEAGLYNNQVQEQTDADVLQKLKDAGVTVCDPDDAAKAAFKAAAQPFYDQFKSEWSPNLYETVQAAMK